MFRSSFTSIRRHRRNFGLGALLLAGSAVAAPVQPTPMPPVLNDGYLRLWHTNADGNFASTDKVCQLDTVTMRSWRGAIECADEQPQVSVQDVLDKKFGHGRAQPVGFAPVNDGEVVVFYRLVTPGH